MTEHVYGIDLGTTYSAIARITELGAADIIPNYEGDATTPSVVFFEDGGSAIVGAEAKRASISDPDSSSLLIKRHMGTEYPQEFQGVTYSPEAISSLILKELVNSANGTVGIEVNKVVITVPAYFGVQEREATRQAGSIAGLDVVGIVTEPVAAALSIASSTSQEQETIMVFDLGGGTFDTTIMNVDSGKIEVVAVDGSRKLGGADWDEVLIDLIVEKFIEAAGLDEDDDPRFDEDFMLDLRLEAEDAKKSLSRREKATLRLAHEGSKANVEVSRQEFEDATQHLLMQTVEISKRTLEIAEEKQPGIKVDRVLLVGGSARMPMVKNGLSEHLGWESQDTEFDLAVAKGAAIYGQAAVEEILSTGDEETEVETEGTARPFLPGSTASLSVSNTLSRAVGIRFVRGADDKEGFISFFAHANDPIPLTPDPVGASTSGEGQTAVDINLYEQAGEVASEVVEDNRFLKKATLDLPKPMPRGSAIDIVVNISSEGIVTVTTTDPESQESVELEAAVSVLTEEQVAEETAKVGALTLRS